MIVFHFMPFAHENGLLRNTFLYLRYEGLGVQPGLQAQSVVGDLSFDFQAENILIREGFKNCLTTSCGPL